ncbi:MAG: type II toxin-antitoxin system HicB family antitoxin [Cyanobacteria bacterium J06626_18]
MRTFTAIVERDSEAHLYVGYAPGLPGAHSQGETLIEMPLENGQIQFQRAFAGIQQIVVG